MAKEVKPNMAKGSDRSVVKHKPCLHCKHLTDVGEQFTEDGWTCKAYPNGIPWDIWAGETNHNTPQLQEGEYVYESKVYEDGATVTFDGEWSE